MAAIEMEDVKKSYGDHEVLKGFNLEVREGEIFGLLGPNGVGKTTLFQTVIGLLKQDGGTIKIDGDPHDEGKRIRQKIGYLPSDISFYEGMSARENLEFFSQLADREPDIDELLELVGLENDTERKVGAFSTGMKKRLGIAQSLIKDPKIIIYDEPTTGLDPEGKRKFRKHVEKINKEKNKTVIISSHITTEISPLCDRFGIMKDGEIVACGTKSDLSQMVETDLGIEITVEDVEKTEKIIEESSIGAELEVEPDKDKITVKSDEDIRSDLFSILTENNAEVKSLDLEEKTLETAYMKLTEV